MSELNEVQTNLINDVARDYGFKDFKICAESGSDKGDNYLGIITTVKLEEGDKTLNLVLKTSHTDETFRQRMKIATIYDRELYLYEKIFPMFETLQSDLPVKYPFKAHVKSLGSFVGDNMECFVMADIRSKGYQMWNRKVPMNMAHLEAIVREYAKLHSIGMIMKNKDPESFERIKDRMFDVWKSVNRTEMDMERARGFTDLMTKKILNIVRNNHRAKDIVESFTPKLFDYYEKYVYNPEFAITITHGDCWCNNMMFKYKNPLDQTKPDEICLLDWQLSKVGSPALDLVYFLFVSADIEQVRNYHHYLNIYYQTLAENLSSVGLDPEKIFPFSTLEEHFKIFSLFGLVISVMILQFIILDKDEVPDLSKMNDGDFEAMLNMESNNQATYSEKLTNLILFLDDNDFILTNNL